MNSLKNLFGSFSLLSAGRLRPLFFIVDIIQETGENWFCRTDFFLVSQSRIFTLYLCLYICGRVQGKSLNSYVLCLVG